MSFTSPPTKTPGQVIEASYLNLLKGDLDDHETRVGDLETADVDQLVGVASSVDKEIVLFDGTTGKATERATGTGYVKVTSGVMGTPSATVPLATDVSGDLAMSNLAQGSALSVLGVTGNATADHASIVAASDGQVLRRSGPSVGFGAVDLANANAITGALPLANLPTNFAQIFRVSATLLDADVKAGPTTPYVVLAAPGAGFVIRVLSGSIYTKTTSGAYTNIDAAGFLAVKYSGGTQAFSFVPNDAAITNGSATNLSDLLGSTTNKVVYMVPFADTEDENTWGPVPPVRSISSLENQGLSLVVTNGGSGNFTGGNAANRLRVTIEYVIEAVL